MLQGLKNPSYTKAAYIINVLGGRGTNGSLIISFFINHFLKLSIKIFLEQPISVFWLNLATIKSNKKSVYLESVIN